MVISLLFFFCKPRCRRRAPCTERKSLSLSASKEEEEEEEKPHAKKDGGGGGGDDGQTNALSAKYPKEMEHAPLLLV